MKNPEKERGESLPTHGQFERVFGIFAEQVVSSGASVTVFIQTGSDGSAGYS